jgi:hypothetical protein
MESKRVTSRKGYRALLLFTVTSLITFVAAAGHAAMSPECEQRMIKLERKRDQGILVCDRRAAADPGVDLDKCIAALARRYNKRVKKLGCASILTQAKPTPPAAGNHCTPVRVGAGVERCVDVGANGAVRLYMNRTDKEPWNGTYFQDDEPDVNYCGPTAGKNFLAWYGLTDLYGALSKEMETNSWDTAPVLGAAGLICAFEPICTSILGSTVSDIAVKAGSLPRFVRESLYGRMPSGYEACGTEGIDSLEDIRQSLANGNPVVFLESQGKGNLHWAMVTGVEPQDNDTMLRVANSSDRLWSTFRADWSLNEVGAGAAEGSCAPNFEQDGELCYPNCRDGYDGVGPVCWQKCAPGFTDDGVTCRHHDLDIFAKDTYGRGVGSAPDSCPAGQERNGSLCYPACGEGYYGAGPVCWQSCPAGYADDGATCRRDGEIISSERDCPWYDTCGLWHDCSWCPEGYVNDGCTCRLDPDIFAKSSYGRGVGSPLTCGDGQQYDAGLCYSACRPGYSGVGPICYQECPADYTDDGATCRRDSGVTIVGKDSYGRGAGTPGSDALLRVLGQKDLGVVPFVAIRWCGSAQ